MDTQAMISELNLILDHLGVKVIFRNLEESTLPARSGLVRVRGEPVVYVHSRLEQAERAEVLIDALKNFDLSDLYISPALRQRLEGA